MSVKSASLYYRDGGSDKVYYVQIEEKDGGYVVNFQFGRRGSTLQMGTKTASPVDLAKAEKIFDKLVKEKAAKGYTPGEDGTPFAGTDKAGEVSGLVPQLLNSIDETRAQELLEDNDWLLQEKMDGFHQMIRVAGDITISNRKGLIVPGSQKIVSALKSLNLIGQPLVFDGETIGDVFHAFDLVELEGQSIRGQGALDRLMILNGILALVNNDSAIRVIRTATRITDKKKLYQKIKDSLGEGVVFKKKNSLYVPGRPASGGNMLKLKFKASATCQVLGVNGEKRSVRVGVLNGVAPVSVHRGSESTIEMLDRIMPIGNVTIPANHEIPSPGQFVEIEYLYAFPGGSLFQPVYKEPRSDKSKPDTYPSLKFKQGTSEEES